MSETTYFARRLRELREDAGLSQYALAKKSGVSKQALSRLEMGASEPAWETVQRLALALGVTCTAFNDPAVQVPEEKDAPPRGRPRSPTAPATAAPAPVEPAPASPGERGTEGKPGGGKRGRKK